MLTLYRIFLYIALPLVLLRLLWRGLRERRYLKNIPRRLGFVGKHHAPGGIWIHAVSVGEVNAATQLVEHLLKKHPDKPITITTMTPTGADRVLKTFGDRVRHCYLPYDYPGAMRRFLGAMRPRIGLVMETEIWPNLIDRCHRNKVPMIYINVRLSKRSHRGYRRFRKLIRPALRKIDHFAAQGKADSRRLIDLGAPPAAVRVTGNLKFDAALPPGVGEAARTLRENLGSGRPVWVAGSTHEGEEEQILEAFAHLRKDFKSLLLVIAPRHPPRFNAVYRLCESQGYNTVLRSHETKSISPDCEVYVADTMGELPLLIAAADLVFIGGSLVPVGGHNVLEASAAGVPVVFGRYMFNFAEIATLLQKHTAGIQVMNADELANAVRRLLNDPLLREQYATRGRELVEKNRGALEKICALVDQELAETVEESAKN